MEYAHRWNYKTIAAFAVLAVLPNLLGAVNLTAWGFKVHFFQIGIFLSAMLFGRYGGLASGLIGSVYSAFVMHNPYIAGGNAILGYFTGLFIEKKVMPFAAAGLAFLIQLPWLVMTDHYLINMPMPAIVSIVIALAVSNAIWIVLASYMRRPAEMVLR